MKNLSETLNDLWQRGIFPSTSIVISEIEKSKIDIELFLTSVCSDHSSVPIENIPDIIFLKLEKQKSGDTSKSISISDVRKMQEEFSNKPLITPFRFGIILGAEYLNLNSGNALLKILEDSPKDTYFILVCENKNQVLSTIKSRAIEIYQENIESNLDLEIVDLVSKILNPEIRFSSKQSDIANLCKYIQENEMHGLNYISKIFSHILLDEDEFDSDNFRELWKYNKKLQNSLDILSFIEYAIKIIADVKNYNLDFRQVIITLIAKYSLIK